jgi:hypothetical protein
VAGELRSGGSLGVASSDDEGDWTAVGAALESHVTHRPRHDRIRRSQSLSSLNGPVPRSPRESIAQSQDSEHFSTLPRDSRATPAAARGGNHSRGSFKGRPRSVATGGAAALRARSQSSRWAQSGYKRLESHGSARAQVCVGQATPDRKHHACARAR